MSNQPTTWLVIQPERDMNAGLDTDETRYEACEAEDATLWAIYLVTQGEGGILLGDFPNERSVRRFVAAVAPYVTHPDDNPDHNLTH